MKALRDNKDKPRWSLLDTDFLEEMIKVREFGDFKYSVFISKHTLTANNEGYVTGAWFLKEYDDREKMKRVIATDYILVSTGADNWKKGLGLRNILDSIYRHVAALMKGQHIDEDSGCLHTAHIAVNVMFYFWERKNRKDA